MTGYDLTHLSPPDAVVALRSYPRRFRQEFAGIEGDDSIEALAQRVGPDGESAAQILSDVTRTWAVLADALQRVLFTDGAVLHPAVTDPAQRSWDTPPPDSLDDGLTLLGHEADAVADVADRAGRLEDWQRSAAVASGGSVTALDVLKDAVQTGAQGLGRVRHALAATTRPDS